MKPIFYLIIILSFSIINLHGGHIDENEIEETYLSKFIISKIKNFSKQAQL